MYRDGWNGVGVGDALGAEVIKINGRGADPDPCGAVLQACKKIADIKTTNEMK